MRANTTQKAYDEAFLACSTAVYFESQHNEKEALRSWRSALDQIYYHNARRNPTTYRPSSETERALVESLRQLELQCKERVDLLEALKKSREESKESLSSTDAQAPTPPPHGAPLGPSDTNASSDWLGGGSIPPVAQSDLARPPPLPSRPSMAPRKSSGNMSKHRISSLTQTMSNSSLNPGPSDDKKSRTPSPDKKGSRMLRTLRPNKDGKPASKMPMSMRSRPEASKAATLAFGSRAAASSSNRAGLNAPKAATPPVNISPRASMEMPAATPQVEVPLVHPSGQDSPKPAPFYFQTREGSGSTNYAVPAPRNNSDTEKPKHPPIPRKAAPAPPPVPSKPAELIRNHSSQASKALPPLPAFPSYRKEYPPAQLDPRLLAASAAARSYSDLGSTKYGNKEVDATRRPSATPTTPSNISRTRNVRREPSPEPIPLAEDGFDDESRRPPHRKARRRGDSMRADLPPNPTAEFGEGGETHEEPDEWKSKTEEILKNLPRGVDKQSAQNILNEIVIQGDEVHWDDVAGLEIAKSALKETVVYPFLRPDLFMGLREPARGMLLFGPPGTGKTMLARAVATESKSTFFAISASSLTSKFLGESEKLVRALFSLAKMLAPSIIFVDEIDSLLSSRGGSSEHEATRRIKTEFLIQWSDLQKAAAGRETSEKDKETGDATRVLVLAATNLPWAIDEAARRRFVRRQYIPLPEDFVRKQQVKTLLSHQKHDLSERDLDRLVALTDGFSGSDITALAKDAAMGPLRSLGESLLTMTMDEIRPIQFKDFQASLRTIRPSVSKQGLQQPYTDIDMAPRKKTEKEEKATGAEGSDMILHYLRETNRPYSAIEISANLRNKVTKAAAAKLLKDLHEQKLIEGRPAGKHITNSTLQSPDDAVSPDQLAEYDTRIAALTTQTTDLHALAKSLRATLASLTSSLSAADILSATSSLEYEKAEIETRLESLRAGKAKKVTAEERAEVDREWKVLMGVEMRREKIAKVMWGMVEDGTESREMLADLREGWGLDE
ncbi:AAA-domain-containing protein [Didymella exigua CBS 183.55]|uniref:AAA-domain-containing protein n=1 Tax=Didymella exigua CBS 183.55 TaxID=1150837 RepID=A0A6A5RLZ7_9PLEO|nr:AAA-domain-containing protein [Didymella exigua CBS 183.55]KAF1928812.1 AAA-domain-containing protein [Didymella exigua CBS 183.55]